METLKIYIERHLNMLNEAIDASNMILQEAEQSNLSALIDKTMNRERLINIIGHCQENIGDHISAINHRVITNELLTVLREWQAEMSNRLAAIDIIDQEILCCLENEKDETTQKIAALFRKKEVIKGYNLSNVK